MSSESQEVAGGGGESSIAEGAISANLEVIRCRWDIDWMGSIFDVFES